MKVLINVRNIESNIKKAQELVSVPVSLMFKEFYEDILPHIDLSCIKEGGEIFATHAEGSVCFSIGKYNWHHKGALVTNQEDALECLAKNIRLIYIPVNAEDDREGLSVSTANYLSRLIRAKDRFITIKAMVTSGCLNDKHPTFEQLDEIWNKLQCFDGMSLGGSFWLPFGLLPKYVTDVRIGEYMLFGTIPYSEDKYLQGKNGIEIEARVIGVYPERREFIVDCGYSLADMDKCKPMVPYDIEYVDSSSEYTIFKCDVSHITLGDTLTFIPNYKSLVKLRNAEHRLFTT